MEQPRILRIIVASPDDVQSEREALPNVVDELNRGIAGDRGLLLQLSRWETDAYPGFHSEGPQGLIDPILKIIDCDLLIGVFWKRFGTPTADGTTGTEHEFRLAYETWKNKGHPQIFVYFNQKPYTPKLKAEIEQWGKVLEFKGQFPKEGLWCHYKGKAQFEKLVRNHLTNYIRNLPKPVDGGNQFTTREKDEPEAEEANQRTVDQLIKSYLSRLYENIGTVRLIGEAESRELKQVFVELSISEEYQRPSARNEYLGYIDAALRKRRNLLWDSDDEEQENEDGETTMVRPDELLRDATRAVITGAPGCGKSTLLRWLVGKVLHDHPGQLPVFLELKSINKKLFEDCRGGLVELLFEQAITPLLHFEHSSERELLKAEFRALLAKHQVAIFLDGLDEIRNAEFFHSLCETLNQFIGSAYGRNLLIISTRPYALDVRFQDAKEMEIAPLNQSQIAEFLHHYYDDDPVLDVSELIQRLQRRELSEMVRAPMLLGALVRRYRKKHNITGDRLKLYEGLVRDLAVIVDQDKNVKRYNFSDKEGRRNLEFLERIAFKKLFAQHIENDAERLTFNGDWILHEAKEFCSGTSIDPFDFAADIKATPLLREVAEDVWAFTHLTIQEYLAARRLADEPNCEQIICRSYFNPTLVEMEALPMILGMAKRPDELYRAIEKLPESLNFAGLRLCARGLAYGAEIPHDQLEDLTMRLIDFISAAHIEETPYSDPVIHSFAGIGGQCLAQISEGITLLLRSEDKDVRKRAADALEKIKGETAIPALLEALRDADADVRWKAADALGRIGGETAIPALLEALRDADGLVRAVAAYGLEKISRETAIPTLLEALRDADGSVRASAADALGRIGGETAVPALLEALRDADGDVRWKAADALAAIGGETAVPALLEALRDADADVRWKAADALARVGGETAIPTLLEALRDADDSVRARAADTLVAIGGETAVAALLEALRDADADVRWKAADALVAIGGETAVAALLEALRDASKYVRMSAADALGRIGGETAVAALLKALRDADADVRWKAAEALGRVGGETAVAALLEASRDADADVRWKAAQALGEISGKTAAVSTQKDLQSKNHSAQKLATDGWGKVGEETAVAALLEALRNASKYVRARAASALGKVGGETAIPALLDAVRDADGYVRAGVASALGKVGGETAIPALLEALRDADGSVRASAASALGRIGGEIAIPALLEALRDADGDVRAKAAYALGKVGGETAIPALLEALRDADGDVRGKAASALGKVGEETAIPALLDALRDAHGNVRAMAASALGRISRETAIPALLEALRDAHGKVRASAADALGRIGGKTAIPALLEALRDADGSVRGNAAYALGRIGGETATSALLEALRDADGNVRWNSASALGRIGGETAVAALLDALRDAHSDVRARAASALGNIKIELFVKGLLSAMSHNNSFVRRKAAEVISYYSDKRVSEDLLLLVGSDPDPEVRRVAEDALTRLRLKMQYGS